MKTLYLIRHAKSSWDDADLNDFERPLNERGEKDAPRMGNRLKERSVAPDAIYSSPALRTLTTAIVIAENLGYPADEIQTDRRLYNAGEETLLEFLHKVPDKNSCVMIVCHNPGITDLANDLLHGTIENVPTAGVVAAELNINSWKAAKHGCGKLIFFDYPKA